MNPRKIGRAIAAFFTGAGMFVVTGIIFAIATNVMPSSHAYGSPNYYWIQLIKTLIVATAGACVASFFAAKKYRGLGLSFGAVYGIFGGLVVGLEHLVGSATGVASGAMLLGIIPCVAAVATGLWAERVFAGTKESDGEIPEEFGRELEGRLAGIETKLRGLESLPERLQHLEGRLAELSNRPAPIQPEPAPVMREAVVPAPLKRSGPLPLPASPLPARSTADFSWDDLLEGRWLFRIGMGIFILGVSFFLKFAFENQWVGPIGRVVMGFIAGVSFIAFGDHQQKKGLTVYGQTMIGGGLGILYLSIFAAFHFYGFLEQFPAFCAMALVTATAAVFALRYSSISIIVVAMAGGFATPALLSTGVVRELPLFAYLALLDIGVLAVSTFRTWRPLNLLAFALTQIWLQFYFSGDYHPDKLALMFAFTTVYFLLFLTANFGFNIQKKIASEPADLILLVANAAFYYGTAYYSLLEHSPWEAWEAHLAVAVGLMYFLMAWQTFERGRQDKPLLLCEMGLASAFAVIAIPIAWKWEWITIGWAVEALILIWIGLRLKDSVMRWAGRGLMLAAGFRAVAFDWDLRTLYEPVLNTRCLSFLTVLVVMAAAILLLKSSEAELTDEEKTVSAVLPIAWNFLCLYWLCAEAQDYLKNVYVPFHPSASLSHYTTVAYSVIWTLYASALMGIGLLRRQKGLRIGGQVLFGATALKAILVDLAELPLGARVISFLVLGGLILLVSYFLQKRQREEAAI